MLVSVGQRSVSVATAPVVTVLSTRGHGGRRCRRRDRLVAILTAVDGAELGELAAVGGSGIESTSAGTKAMAMAMPFWVMRTVVRLAASTRKSRRVARVGPDEDLQHAVDVVAVGVLALGDALFVDLATLLVGREGELGVGQLDAVVVEEDARAWRCGRSPAR